MRNSRLLQSKLNRLLVLLDEHTEMFFQERPFLETKVEDPQIRELPEDRKENESKIKKVAQAILEETGYKEEKIDNPEQKALSL